MLTAESVFARLASTLVNEIEWIRDFFVPILNKQMTETSQEAKNPCVLISFKPQRSLSQWGRQLLGHAAFPWKGPGKAVWARRVPGPLDTPPPASAIAWHDRNNLKFYCFVLSLRSIMRGSPDTVTWCVKQIFLRSWPQQYWKWDVWREINTSE